MYESSLTVSLRLEFVLVSAKVHLLLWYNYSQNSWEVNQWLILGNIASIEGLLIVGSVNNNNNNNNNNNDKQKICIAPQNA